MRKNILAILVHIIIWAVSFSSMSAWARPYQPENSIRILTEPMENKKPIEWVVTPEAPKNGSTGIGFYREESGQFICRLVFSGDSADIFWQGMNRSPNTIKSGDLLIVSGMPIPCDVLPVAKLFAADEPFIYEARINAGGRTFVERIQVMSTLISMEEARTKGWLKYNKDVQGELRLIKAVNLRTDELMVQQLWADDCPWWIYEETPYRRSWQVR
jgi:hypothetical protein